MRRPTARYETAAGFDVERVGLMQLLIKIVFSVAVILVATAIGKRLPPTAALVHQWALK